MSSTITVKPLDSDNGWRYKVFLEEDGERRIYDVSLCKKFYAKLDTKASQEEVVKQTFCFLLDNEPKESIFHSFEIKTVSRYFPKFVKTIKASLNND